MNETHLSMFHSVSNRSRNSVSSVARYLFVFLFRARDFTTFTLHDLTDFYVERATAPHYNKSSFMFSLPLAKFKNAAKIKSSLRAGGGGGGGQLTSYVHQLTSYEVKICMFVRNKSITKVNFTF